MESVSEAIRPDTVGSRPSIHLEQKTGVLLLELPAL